MSEIPAAPARLTGWNASLEATVCERCQWRFLAPSGSGAPICPNCHQRTLSILPDGLSELPNTYPPELVLPFNQTPSALDDAIREFTKGIPYPPEDLHPQNLRSRLARVYLPMWLIDACIAAQWQSEVGFNYEVVSHQEHYDQNRSGWASKEVKEARVRWENRVGRINRDYHNIAVSGLEDAARLKKELGDYQLHHAAAYIPECLDSAFVRLPDLHPKEAWSEAAAAFQKVAADDCQRACDADHQRQFRWKAQFTQLNWTLLLLPAYSSYYLDDSGRPHPILINGQTGQVAGARMASMRRAQNRSLAFLLVGIILFLTGMILETFTATSALIGLFSTLAILGGIGSTLASLVPYVSAWDFNRKQDQNKAQ
jgi:hypothetical protein